MITGIRHIWFDFSDTIAHINKKESDRVLYETFAEVTKRNVTPELIEEYKKLRQEHGSATAIFVSLGKSSTFLADRLAKIEPRKLYQLADETIPDVLQKLKESIPISIFSNNKLDVILPALGIASEWFTHILGPEGVKNPKPALDGFYKMVELSEVPAETILFIGDDVQKDLIPAKKIGIKAGLLWAESGEAEYCFKDFSDILERFSAS